MAKKDGEKTPPCLTPTTTVFRNWYYVAGAETRWNVACFNKQIK